MHFQKRDYFGTGAYIDHSLGIGYDTALFSGSILFPDEPENYFLKYEFIWRGLCTGLSRSSTDKLFLSVIMAMKSFIRIILLMTLFQKSLIYYLVNMI